MKNTVETLINLFTVHEGKISILLLHKKDDPYKGYWMLPTSTVRNNETLEENILNRLDTCFHHHAITLSQNEVYSDLDRNPDSRVIGISYVGLVDAKTIELGSQDSRIEMNWFDITMLPKLAYDHARVIGDGVHYLRNKFKETATLTELYPSDFTLPELQHIYEIIFNKQIDRRNFRKKFIRFGLIEETGDIIKGSTGRPAKLYRFKDDIEKEEIF